MHRIKYIYFYLRLFHFPKWNPGKTPKFFETTIEVVSGDGTIIQTWEYDKCEVTNYDIYLDDSLLNYKYHERW